MLENNIYNIDREFDYPIVKAIVLKSLEDIVKEEALKNKSNVSDDVVFGCSGNNDPNEVKLSVTVHFIAKHNVCCLSQ